METIALHDSHGLQRSITLMSDTRLIDVVNIAYGSNRAGKVVVDQHGIEMDLGWTLFMCSKLYPRMSFTVIDRSQTKPRDAGGTVLVTLSDVPTFLLPEYRAMMDWIARGAGEYHSGFGTLVKLGEANCKVWNKSHEAICETAFDLCTRKPSDTLEMTISAEAGRILILSTQQHPAFCMYVHEDDVDHAPPNTERVQRRMRRPTPPHSPLSTKKD